MLQEGAMQPNRDMSGPARAKYLQYIVLRNVSEVLAVYRILLKKQRPVLKRLKRWPREIE